MEIREAVLSSLYAGSCEQPPWSGFLARVGEATLSDYVSLVFRSSEKALGDVRIFRCGTAGETTGQVDMDDMLREAHLGYDMLQPGRAYRLDEILSGPDPRQQRYLHYLHERSMADTVVVRVTDADIGNAWLSISRNRSRYDRSAPAFLDWIAPHLLSAAHMRTAIERERVRADILADAVQRLRLRWITFDRLGHVLDWAAGTETLFADRGERGLARGWPLHMQATSCDGRERIFEAFARDGGALPRIVQLDDDPSMDMLLMPIRYRGDAGEAMPVAVGYLRGFDQNMAQRCSQLMSRFALSRKEAMLALALTQGRTIGEAAQDLDIALETARNYSKRLYAKTGTKGQADLVRHILAGIFALT